MAAPTWTETFQRLVLALASQVDHDSAWAQLTPTMFGAGAGHVRTPRERVAQVVVDHWREYHAAPGVVVLRERVTQVAHALSDAERRALIHELDAVTALALPSEYSFVLTQVNEFATYQRFAHALLDASALLDAPARNYETIRALLSERLAAVESADARPVEFLVAEAHYRIHEWGAGDETAGRIPTGLDALDRAIGGGPRPGEVFYFIAPPKGAKTTFLLTTALGAVRRRFNVLKISYEMPARRVLYRGDRGLTRATRQELHDNPKLLEQAIQGLRAAGAGELAVWESVPQQHNACDEAARMIAKLRAQGMAIDLVVLDYLNIMGASTVEREKRHELARISREIAALAKNEGVAIWSAALAKREAVNKRIVRKTDISESFEIIAVLDGAIAICSDSDMRAKGLRSLFAAALREEEDERACGTYQVDLARMRITPAQDLDEWDATTSDIS